MEGDEDWAPTFCIGQHETRRTVPVSPQLVQLAQEGDYDMLTTPITTPLFHSRVLTLLSTHLSDSKPPVYDATITLGTSHNTHPVTVPPLSPDDTFLTPNECTSQLVGITSPWIDLCSPDPLIADISRQVLDLEVAYAAFCGVSFIIVPGPRLCHGNLHGEGLIYFGRAIQDILNVGLYIQVHIWFNMIDTSELETNDVGDLAPFARAEYLTPAIGPSLKVDLFGTWEAWDVIRKLCKYQSRLFVALSLPKQLPPMSVQLRWQSEPVHILTIAGSSFIKNQKGYPVLSKAHQALIARMMRLRNPPWIILCDVGPIAGYEVSQSGSETDPTPKISPESDSNSAAPTPAETHRQFKSGSNKKNFDPTPHLSYIRNLQQKQPGRTPMERFGVGYQDYLQAPLQPLTVNLESITYEVFEKDPIKYEWYERAIAKALKDWAAQGKPTCHPEGHVVLAVVGAGRGPLVTRAIRASVEAGVVIEVWAVEKNPNAYVLLQRHNASLWGGCVNLVKSDMRSWKGPHRLAPESGSGEEQKIIHTPIDILVSELLGSFGDNELSPECLDGVTHLLNPVHGISIPASYSAHLSPISSPRLHADIAAQSITNPAAPETPYVVMLHAFDFLSTIQPSTPAPIATAGRQSDKSPSPPANDPSTPIIQSAWSFSHPNHNIPPHSSTSSTILNSHNVRRTRLAFPCQKRGTCHGLAGYFETVLYDDVELSTNPVTMDEKSPGMISWFPIYFPLKTPLIVPPNSEIIVTMYRQTDNRKVWYEWIVEVFAWDTSLATTAADITNVALSPPSKSSSLLEAKDNENRRDSVAAPVSPMKRVRVAMSELHSSIKDGCLM
ncbi:arginine N-methyltransferase skb1 [Paracoccidioides lutzii Pb01]|uniref:Protein arginine N-methyltransferase n=1 Tax=Paracoccidioides lutzii (strain ATCC MYA-826 / Pb01) TaxID=502779 RepID=C1GUS9_PARBA|nr:arginine N-methyltransferase skb1 [Paracoccidioides lutzii Pb01]EEH40347.2 arginine N-methyltransferase skb1 [Paracoccidioides lutzii Pb01]